MAYKIFDPANPNNYRQVNAPANPPWNHQPIGIVNQTGEVVYGPLQQRNQIGAATPQIRRYTTQEYKLRRKYCDSALGMLMIDNPQFTQAARTRVTEGIRQFVANMPPPPPPTPPGATFAQKMQRVHHLAAQPSWGALVPGRRGPINTVMQAGRHLGSPTSFGRHFGPGFTPVIQAQPMANIARWIRVINGDDVPRSMSLYDVFFEIYVTIESRRPGSAVLDTTRDEARRRGVREAWFDQGGPRGRANRNPKAPTHSIPGIIPNTPGIVPGASMAQGIAALQRAGVGNNGLGNYPTAQMTRRRGIDMFAVTGALHTPYAQGLANNRLNFSASASGTTSTLIASAMSFFPGILTNNEFYKQYVMACVAYLVGGGMHTCHEVFYTAGLAGTVAYIPGTYLNMLPFSFRNSPAYTQWRNEFWDVVR